MVDWNFPVSLPKFTDEKFEVEQAVYVSKHGYYVDVPGLEDVIHLGWNKERKSVV